MKDVKGEKGVCFHRKQMKISGLRGREGGEGRFKDYGLGCRE